MIDNPGRRIAAGFLKLFAGIAIGLLLLNQQIYDAVESGEPQAENATGHQKN